CLLIAGNASNFDGRAEQSGLAVHFARGSHLGQQAARNAEQIQELVVPIPAQVVEHGARGVGHINDVMLAVRELPHEPRVDRAERELAALRAFTRARYIVEQPTHLAAGKVGVNDEAGALLDVWGATGGFEGVTE